MKTMTDEFQLVAGHLALDFANTLDYRYDPKRRVELLRDYEHLLEFAGQSGVITRRQVRQRLLRTSRPEAMLTLKRAIEVREALNRLFRSIVAGEPPRRSCLQALNHFLAATRVSETISWRQSEFVRSYSDLASQPDAPIWPIVDAAANLLASPERTHIRECSDPSCRWLFLDHSKNHSRRWCDMRICGNRSKVQRFRARQH